MLLYGPLCRRCGTCLSVAHCLCDARFCGETQNNIFDVDAIQMENDFTAALVGNAIVAVHVISPDFPKPALLCMLATCLAHRFPDGIVVFHVRRRRCCILRAGRIPEAIKSSTALELLKYKRSIGYILGVNGFAEITVTDASLKEIERRRRRKSK